jgi:hypothetical protein
MTKEEYELHYWESVRNTNFSRRYQSQIELFEIGGDLGDILEIGTGPRGGILPFVTAKRKLHSNHYTLSLR